MTYDDYIGEFVYASAESICDDIFGRLEDFDRAKAEKFLKNEYAWNSDMSEFDTEELRDIAINEVGIMYSASYTDLTVDMFERLGVMFCTSDCEIDVEVSDHEFAYYYLDDPDDTEKYIEDCNVNLDFEFGEIEKICDAQIDNEVRGIINR